MTETLKSRLGFLLLVLGAAGVLFAFGPAQFADRLSGRVDAVGVVQWGVSTDAVSDEDRLGDGDFGVWKVDYKIDGAAHAGAIVGSYHAGQELIVSAPADGSFYTPLREGTATWLKAVGWIVAPLSVAAIVLGMWFMFRAMRVRDLKARAEARAQLARMYPQMFPLQPVVAPHPQAPSRVAQPLRRPQPTPPTPQGGSGFFAPYDI